MDLYIGKEKETLYDIAQKYNLTFEELVQFKNKNPLKITASLEVKNIVELFNSFIKSIIEKDFDKIKLTLQEMNKWPEKFSDRFLDKYKDKLVVSFKKLIEEIRDYILNIGNEDYLLKIKIKLLYY